MPEPVEDAKYFAVRFKTHYTGYAYVTGVKRAPIWAHDDEWRSFVADGLNELQKLFGMRGVFGELLRPGGLKLNVEDPPWTEKSA